MNVPGLRKSRPVAKKVARPTRRARRLRKGPQIYSLAGIIGSAMRLSEKREDVWCRVSS
jgi:hypothetical protein